MDNFKGPEPVGCWESFIKGISSIWSTSDLLTGEETEERVRTVTRELGIYMVFLGILCWGKLLSCKSIQGTLKKWTEHSQEWHLLKIHSRGAPTYYTLWLDKSNLEGLAPSKLLLAGWGLIFWTMSFYNLKTFISRSF